jgi:diadenylate cyclase
MKFFLWSTFKPTLEILILWFVIYRMLVFFEGTRAFQVLRGITYLVIAYLISQILGLDTIIWLLTKFFGLSIIAILIIFQQELRQGLARLGQGHLFTVSLGEAEIIALIDEIVDAIYKLSKKKIGCLIAIQREAKLTSYTESGVAIEGKISSALLQSIFMPTTPLHDGGVIANGDMILAASCLFPLSDNPNFSKIVGTRHRAAVGLTEQTDAVVVMVSEETGEVSIACDGRFIPVANNERCFEILKELVVRSTKKKK